MSTAVLPAPVETPTEAPELVHIVCSRCLDWRILPPEPLLAYCGEDMTGQERVAVADYGPDECVVCADIVACGGRCPMCGAR